MITTIAARLIEFDLFDEFVGKLIGVDDSQEYTLSSIIIGFEIEMK
jgi:hypothetical protein